IQSGSPFTLAPGQTGTVLVTFAPANADTFTGAVVFTSNGGNSTNQVTGTSLPPGQLVVLPQNLDFGAAIVGSSVQASFVATNSGADLLTNVAVSISAGPFSIESAGSFALQGFSATNVVVSFNPTNEGTFTNLVFFAASSGPNRINRVR